MYTDSFLTFNFRELKRILHSLKSSYPQLGIQDFQVCGSNILEVCLVSLVTHNLCIVTVITLNFSLPKVNLTKPRKLLNPELSN